MVIWTKTNLYNIHWYLETGKKVLYMVLVDHYQMVNSNVRYSWWKVSRFPVFFEHFLDKKIANLFPFEIQLFFSGSSILIQLILRVPAYWILPL